MRLAKQSTAKSFIVGPILDADGVAKTDEVVGSIKVTKNGTVGAPHASSTLTHDHTGKYIYAANAGDFDTVGETTFSLNSTTNDMQPVSFTVVEEDVHSFLFAAGSSPDADIAAIMVDVAGLDGAAMRGTDNAATAANLAIVAGYIDTEVASILAAVDTEVAAIKAKTDNLPASPAATGDIPTVSQIWTTALTEAYRSTGATGTAAQLLYEILQNITEFAISSTTKTVKKLDGSTTAKTYTLDSATTPTSITETT